MDKTITFVTNQYSCDRIIYAAREIADETKTELIVVEILDSEYELNPPAVDYLFKASKRNKATMRMLFCEDKMKSMMEVISQYDCKHVVTGMPDSNQSILYRLWKEFPEKGFFTVDSNGQIVEVASNIPETSNINAGSMRICLA
ncbi:MAG: hypothetical protein LBV27_08930 [Oscillospiraceae bacterium]|jgi:K+-sensing histidine kinase KdpD|nr:hypothetical protein [Oscillospiraceae bacterium]